MVPLFLKRTRCGNVDVSIFGRVLKVIPTLSVLNRLHLKISIQ